jgi:anti-anti-sigma regulatory factor
MPGKENQRAPVVVRLPAEIDITSREQSYDRLYAALCSGAKVVIADFTATAFCDCGALRRLVSAQRRAAARDAQLRLVIRPGSAVSRIAALMEVDRMVPVYPSIGLAAAGRSAAADPDIGDLIGADQLHILRWQGRLGQLRRDRDSRSEAAVTWDTLAALIDLHMRAEDEVCGPAFYATATGDAALARQLRDDHDDVREIIREANLQPAGVPSWWRLAGAALDAWSGQYYYEQQGRPGHCRHGADPALRRQVLRQWRAFREDYICDLYGDARTGLPACQLRLACPVTPRLADPAFGPLDCTCEACTARLPFVPRSPR